MQNLLQKYFPGLSPQQLEQFSRMEELYREWNAKINVISRKDIDALYERHVLHSLAIAAFMNFKDGTRILDVGTGGGFPALPLAVFFPGVDITLCDSIAKKIKVAENIGDALGLGNTHFVAARAETVKEKFHFITSRAVASMAELYRWTQGKLETRNLDARPNGYLFLKGGDLAEEKKELKALNGRLKFEEVQLSTYFTEAFFESKKLVYAYA